LHHLLMDAVGGPIVLTSGNASDEPQATDNADARERLGGIADGFLMHDRDIVNRLDDSVVAVVAGNTQVLRRARGYAPEPVPLPPGFEGADEVLALGGALKNTFCLVSGGRAIVSQHIGDMADRRALADADDNLAMYQGLYDFAPRAVAIDKHPDMIPSRASQWPDADIAAVQHHHAHLAACLVEHGVERDTRPVLGVVLDGLGYGDDGALWGGEFLLADYTRSERIAHFAPVPLPGGERAMREPWRNTWAHLDAAFGWDAVAANDADLEPIRWLAERPTSMLMTMCARGLNSPPASSAGRLFDAVAGALGICRESMSHEAEAAMALETLARAGKADAGRLGYPVLIGADDTPVMSWAPLWRALLDDLRAATPSAVIAARFHNGLAQAVASLAADLRQAHHARAVVLTGGVFQNRLLLETVTGLLARWGEPVLLPNRLPANDGGLSLGQAAVVAARRLR
ncbi:MAG: Sua5/YciO/YrdC/YwlC family protein, partial [Pseudomonadota bacterium]